MTCIAEVNTVWYASQWPMILHLESKENCCGGLCLLGHNTWCIHSCNALLLLKVAHQANILVATFLIAIEKCLLSCLVGIIQNNDSNVARLAGSWCKLSWLSCSLSKSSFMPINTCSCIESFKQQLRYYLTCTFALREAEGEANVSCTSLVPFPFLLLDTIVPGIWFLMFSSCFSRSSTMDVFPSMGRHIVD